MKIYAKFSIMTRNMFWFFGFLHPTAKSSVVNK